MTYFTAANKYGYRATSESPQMACQHPPPMVQWYSKLDLSHCRYTVTNKISYIVGIPYSRCNNPGGDCCRVRGYWKHDRNEKHAQEKVMQNMEKTIDGTQPAPVDMQYVYIYIIVINYLNGLGKFQNHQQ